MVLLLGEEGPLRDAIVSECNASGLAVRLASTDQDDLFLRAMEERAVIYLPSATILEGKLHPAPDPERMGRVLEAANAPGVAVLVVALPSATGYEPELARLRKHGAPYVLWELPVPIEELAEALERESAHWIWLPTGEQMRVSSLPDAAKALVEGLATEEQGRVLRLPGRQMETTRALQEAAIATRGRVHVRGVWPWLYRALRPIVRWLRGWEPDTLGLLEQLRVLDPIGPR